MNRRLEDAALALGATPAEAHKVGTSDLVRITAQQARRLLGERSFIEQRDAKLLRTAWRYRQLSRFRTDRGRLRLVRLFETRLTGLETEPPADVVEAIEHMLAADRERTPDVPLECGARDYDRYRRRLTSGPRPVGRTP